jgi:predicted DNA binding CopG/RHH family protein
MNMANPVNYQSKKQQLVNEFEQKLVDLDQEKLFTKAYVDALKHNHTGHLALAIAISVMVTTALLLIFRS